MLLLLFDPGPPRTPPQRASDADREIAVDMLCAAVADGRLTLAELEERVEAALSARTLTDLAALIADLSPREFLCEFPRGSPRGVPGDGRTPRPESGAMTRWALIQSLVNALPADTRARMSRLAVTPLQPRTISRGSDSQVPKMPQHSSSPKISSHVPGEMPVTLLER